MERRDLPPFWVIFGVGVVVVAALWFLLASLGRSVGANEPVATLLIPTQTPTETPMPSSLLTAGSATAPSSPLPTIAFEIAPDFTLERADGSTFTLSEQLAQGPVVLLFFQRCG
jgi:hypothetical protein